MEFLFKLAESGTSKLFVADKACTILLIFSSATLSNTDVNSSEFVPVLFVRAGEYCFLTLWIPSVPSCFLFFVVGDAGGGAIVGAGVYEDK